MAEATDRWTDQPTGIHQCTKVAYSYNACRDKSTRIEARDKNIFFVYIIRKEDAWLGQSDHQTLVYNVCFSCQFDGSVAGMRERRSTLRSGVSATYTYLLMRKDCLNRKAYSCLRKRVPTSVATAVTGWTCVVIRTKTRCVNIRGIYLVFWGSILGSAYYNTSPPGNTPCRNNSYRGGLFPPPPFIFTSSHFFSFFSFVPRLFLPLSHFFLVFFLSPVYFTSFTFFSFFLYIRGRGVGDGSENGGFPWRAECLPPTARDEVVAAAAALATSLANGAAPIRPAPSKAIVPVSNAPISGSIVSDSIASVPKPPPPPMRLTRRWSLASWSELCIT